MRQQQPRLPRVDVVTVKQCDDAFGVQERKQAYVGMTLLYGRKPSQRRFLWRDALKGIN